MVYIPNLYITDFHIALFLFSLGWKWSERAAVVVVIVVVYNFRRLFATFVQYHFYWKAQIRMGNKMMMSCWWCIRAREHYSAHLFHGPRAVVCFVSYWQWNVAVKTYTHQRQQQRRAQVVFSRRDGTSGLCHCTISSSHESPETRINLNFQAFLFFLRSPNTKDNISLNNNSISVVVNIFITE